MIVPAQMLRTLKPVEPFCERTRLHGVSYGLSPCGYDVRIFESISLYPGAFGLASTVERFKMPPHLLGIVHDKSTWARLGLAVQNTVVEPGWEGYLTMELTNHGRETVVVPAGSGIAQIIFHVLQAPTEQPYEGKYQNQKAGVQEAILE